MTNTSGGGKSPRGRMQAQSKKSAESVKDKREDRKAGVKANSARDKRDDKRGK